jgi:hypothetical protein
MIAAGRVREMLNNRPFRPFRLFLSDGSRDDVPHPEFAWVFGGRVFVGVPGRNGDPLSGTVKELSILHLTRIEELPQRKRRS